MASRASALGPHEVVLQHLRGGRRDIKGSVFQAILLLSLLICLGLLVLLLSTVATGGWSIVTGRGSDFVTAPLSSLPELAGVGQGITGSLLLMAFVALLAFPLGIGAAVYLEEYATSSRLTRLINVNIRNLAGVPSIVYGLLGFAIIFSTGPWKT